MANEVTVISKEIRHDVGKVERDEYSDCTPEEIESIKQMEKLISEIESPAVTNVLDNLKFKSDIDKIVFDRLPLTTNQKEYLLLSVNTDYLMENIPEEHGANPAALK